MERNPKVFCSHRSADKPQVKKIAALLAAAGIDPWIDEWEIRPGDDLVARINEGLATYDVGLLFLSKSSLESGWVSAEASTLIYQRIQEGKRVIPVMIEADAPVPPLLKPLARLGFEQTNELIDAIYNRLAGKPQVAPLRTRAHERSFRIILRSAAEGGLAIRAESDGQSVAPEQTSRLGADFPFTYQDFLHSVPRARSPAEAAAASRAAELTLLGDSVGRVVFPEPVALALSTLLDKARSRGESVILSFETAEPNLLSIPFEAACLPGERVPALETNVRVLRRYLGAASRDAEPLPGPLRILVAVGAPDEDETPKAVLDFEAELQTILDAVDTARKYGNAAVKILEVGHPRQIQAALEEQSFHVLHLSGHGSAGTIEMENEDGEACTVTPQELTDAIHAAGRPLPLVFLTSYLSETAENETASFAQGLLEQGVPLVLAMQSTVSDYYTTQLAGSFYGHLSRMEVPLPSHALALARQEIEQERRKALAQGRQDPGLLSEYATPALFCVGGERPLLDRGLPQLDFRSTVPPVAAGPVPMLRIGDLIGRRSELREILQGLRGFSKTGVAIYGIGGVGKSALAGRAMGRLAEEGWRPVAVEGCWTLNELASRVGAALLIDRESDIAKTAEVLVQSTLPDGARLSLLGQLLGAHPILLVLDNFEDNLTLGGSAFRAASTAAILETLYRAANRGKLLVTSRYPLPGSEPWLARLDLGPLSPAQTRKLLYRLSELKGRSSEALGKVLRLIGGHPRMLEYLDAILRGGQGRLAIVEEKLRKNVTALGLRIEDLGGDLDQSVEDAIQIGAQEIFLEELLQLIDLQPGDRELLNQASVFPMPVDLPGLASALAEAQEPELEQIDQARRAVGRLTRMALLTPRKEDSAFVHRWTAEALKKTMIPETFRACCHRAAYLILWRLQSDLFSTLGKPLEALRLFSQAEEFDHAFIFGNSLINVMREQGQFMAQLSISEELLNNFPTGHSNYLNILQHSADALSSLGLTEEALRRYYLISEILFDTINKNPKGLKSYRDLFVICIRIGDLSESLGDIETAREAYEKALEIAELLVRNEPNHTEHLRDLSIAYSTMGDVNRHLGQIDDSLGFYKKALKINEQLARDEPNRADYLRDLLVSYRKIGESHRTLEQREISREFYEKSLEIATQLNRDEPGRVDHLIDLATSLTRTVYYDPEHGRSNLKLAVSILKSLKKQEVLAPIYDPWLLELEQFLESLRQEESAT
ncbi:MAG: TIR domain-containing protein [Thermoanaerobaculia bacterium]